MTNPRPHTIYIVKVKDFDGPYKIGVTCDLERRIRHINNASPFEVELIASFPGDRRLEGRIHASLLEAHIRCEWFMACDAVLNFIERVRSGSFDHETLPAPKGVSGYINGKPRPPQRRAA